MWDTTLGRFWICFLINMECNPDLYMDLPEAGDKFQK